MTWHAPLSHWLTAAGPLLADRLPEAASAQTVDAIVQWHEVKNRAFFMHRGRIWAQSPSTKLFASPQTPELRQFVCSDIKYRRPRSPARPSFPRPNPRAPAATTSHLRQDTAP